MKTKAKKKIKSLATLKRKKAIGRRAKTVKDILENTGKSVSKAMLDAGYSPSYAKNPQDFKKTRKWKEIMDDKLSEEMVAEVHAELLKATKLEQAIFPLGVADELIRLIVSEVGCVVMKIVELMGKKYVWYRAPDAAAKKAAVDMVYKLRGKYAAEKFEEVNPLKKLSNAELAEKKKVLLDFLLKRKTK
ncbi:MAG: hypothetical protein ACD_5C00075G0013 [uncultured bacterium]|nr:MAG: hypothetical protein ACD_5C00075G0013 [uncultured bacterium]